MACMYSVRINSEVFIYKCSHYKHGMLYNDLLYCKSKLHQQNNNLCVKRVVENT